MLNKEIPQLGFSPAESSNEGFEIVSIDKIEQHRLEHKVDPEKPHQLNFYNLIYFTEGEGKHFIDFKWYSVKANSIVYLAKDQVNAFKFSPKLKGYCIIFSEAYFVKLLAHLPSDFISRLFNPQLVSPVLSIPTSADLHEYIELLRREYALPNTPKKSMIIDALFVIVLAKAESLKLEEDIVLLDHVRLKIFQEFITLLGEQFSMNRSAQYYAKKLAISYKHLNELCKALRNKTAKSIIDEFIILQAKRNLINSDIKSTQLAYKMGFEDPTNFSKYFKKHTGITPKAFKNRM